MTPTAVFFLILSAVVIWGGLLASIARLRYDGRHAADDALDEAPVGDDGVPGAGTS